MSCSEETRGKVLMQTDPNSNLSLLNRYKILLARCLYSLSYFASRVQWGKTKGLRKVKPLNRGTEARQWSLHCSSTKCSKDSSWDKITNKLGSLHTQRQIYERSVKLRPFIISQESGAQAVLNMETQKQNENPCLSGSCSCKQFHACMHSSLPWQKFEGPSAGAVLERSELYKKIRAALWLPRRTKGLMRWQETVQRKMNLGRTA